MTTSVVDLGAQYKLLRFEGPGVHAFLQGQLSANILDISEHSSRFSGYCNPKGRLIATLRVFFYQDHYYLSIPSEMVDIVTKRLRKFAIFSKIEIDIIDHLAHLGFIGEPEQFSPLPDTVNEAVLLEDMLIVQVYGTRPCYELIGPPDTLDILKLTVKHNFTDWQCEGMIRKIATIYPETSELFTPHALGLEHFKAVSLDKGCYVGQEIIARTQYLGKQKRHLHLLNSPVTVNRGNLVFSGDKEVGTVVDTCLSEAGKVLLLAVLQDQVLSSDKFYLIQGAQEHRLTLLD